MGTGKFVTVYPGVWTEREKPYAEEYYAKIKELEDRGPIDVEALISGKIEKGTQGFSNVLEVKEDMMDYNAGKFCPDFALYSDAEYAKIQTTPCIWIWKKAERNTALSNEPTSLVTSSSTWT